MLLLCGLCNLCGLCGLCWCSLFTQSIVRAMSNLFSRSRPRNFTNIVILQVSDLGQGSGGFVRLVRLKKDPDTLMALKGKPLVCVVLF